MSGSNPFENGGNTICFVALAVFYKTAVWKVLDSLRLKARNQENRVSHISAI